MTNLIKATFLIHGMNCKSCAVEIMKALKKAKGIIHSELLYKEGKINIAYDKKVISLKDINNILEPLGYYMGHTRHDDIQIKSLAKKDSK